MASKAKKPETSANRRVSQKEFAALLGLTERTVYNLIHEGMPVAEVGKPGRPSVVDLAVAVPWYVDREVRRRAPAATEETQRERLYRVQADRMEIETQAREGQLLDATTVGHVLTGAWRVLCSALDGVAGRNANRLATMRSPGEIRRLLLDEIRGARGRATVELSRLADLEGDARGAKAAAKPAARRVGKRGKGAAVGRGGAGGVPK